MALALYRKYRPRTFAEVIGQEHVTEPLSQALRSGRLHHAYLFSGPRGCGKTSSARILARSLNCVQGPTPEPCGECESCRSLANDGAGSIDVIEIDAASHGGVDDARELRERAFFAPVSSRYKIYVIDEAHMVSTQGFNALLKLVEEPPEYVKFIFATTEPDKVLGTIKSRTHHYPFRLIPPGTLRPYLEQLCQAERVTVEPAVFPLVVRAGGGSARDTLSVLDQLIAGAGPEGVSYPRAVALLGVTDAALIDEMCDALAAGDGAAAYATIDRVAEAGHDPRRFAADLLERLRDLIILQQVPDAVAKGLIDGPADQIERMSAQSQRMGAATLSRCADIVHTGLVEMRGTTGPRLLLELICARMLLPGADDSSGALLQRLERMERRLTPGGDAPAPAAGHRDASASARTAHTVRAAEAAGPAEVVEAAGPAEAGGRGVGDVAEAVGHEPAPRRQMPPEAIMPDPATPEPERPGIAPAAPDAAAVRRVWDEVLGLVNRVSRVAAAYLREATVREVDGDTLAVIFKHHMHASRFTTSPELLVDALYEVLGVRWELRCEVGGDQRSGPPGGRAVPAQPRHSPVAAGAAQSGGPTGGQGGPRARAAGPATAAAGGPATAGGREDDGGWPETARPGGAAVEPTEPRGSGAPAHAAPAAQQTPTAAQPRQSSTPQTQQSPASRAQQSPASRASQGNATRAQQGIGPRPQQNAARAQPGRPGSGVAQARAAAAAAGNGRARVPDGSAQPAAGSAWDDSPPPDEPPYDPEYDGFDPGDEPLDDVVDERTARQSSEAQALQLLKEKLGAEKIAEIDAR